MLVPMAASLSLSAGELASTEGFESMYGATNAAEPVAFKKLRLESRVGFFINNTLV